MLDLHMKLNPSTIRNQVQIALTIEPILDKEGCTTRYIDLADKPLTDFLITAVNSGESIERHAKYIIDGGEEVFRYLISAMKSSNDYKGKKNINFGLLVFLFMAIKARCNSKTLTEAIDNMDQQLKQSSTVDVKNYMQGWELNIQTTTKFYKKKKTDANLTYFYEASNLYNLFSRGIKVFKDPKLTSYQFCFENIKNYPLLRKFISEINDEESIIRSIEKTYAVIHKLQPEISPGLLADLSATAIFLHISFKNPNNYIVK